MDIRKCYQVLRQSVELIRSHTLSLQAQPAASAGLYASAIDEVTERETPSPRRSGGSALSLDTGLVTASAVVS